MSESNLSVGLAHPTSGIVVFAADEQTARPVDLQRWRDLALAVLEAEGLRGEVEVSLLFVDEATIAELNQRFLDRSGSTDVLAFPIDDEPMPGGRAPDAGGSGPGWVPATAEDLPRLLGDVVICPEVAHRNVADAAQAAGTDTGTDTDTADTDTADTDTADTDTADTGGTTGFEDELALLVVHGILHLQGMDHALDAEAEKMEAREQELLAALYRPREGP